MKRGGSLSFLVGTISNVLVMEIGWTDVGSGGYILVSYVHSNTSLFLLLLIFSNLLSFYFFFYYLCLTGVVLYANIVMYATNVVIFFSCI